MSVAEKRSQSLSSNKENEFESAIPLKVVLRLSPLEIGVFYKLSENSNKKKLYLVELKNLLPLDDCKKITDAIFQQHQFIFQSTKISYSQIYNIVTKLMEYLKSDLMDDEEEYSMGELASNLYFNKRRKRNQFEVRIHRD